VSINETQGSGVITALAMRGGVKVALCRWEKEISALGPKMLLGRGPYGVFCRGLECSRLDKEHVNYSIYKNINYCVRGGHKPARCRKTPYPATLTEVEK